MINWVQALSFLVMHFNESSYHIISYFQSCRLIAYWLLLMAPPCVVSVCSVGVGEVFCSVLFVWNFLGGPHESGYIYLLTQSSPLAQCSTATTCTIQTRLCSVPLWTEDLWGALWHVNLPLFFFTSGSGGIRTRDLQRERQALYQLSYPATSMSDQWMSDVTANLSISNLAADYTSIRRK